MVAFATQDMGGLIPRRESFLLPPSMAEDAYNCDLASGPLDGLPQPLFVIDLAGTASFTVKKAYRVPGPNPGDAEIWMPLPSPYSSVVRSPLANDTLHRVYWSNPPNEPDPGVFWNTYARMAANQPRYTLGFIPPDPAIILTAVPSGGDTTVPAISRSYTFTYIDEYGLETSPASPSEVVDGPPDATWTVSGLPTAAPSNPAGKFYPVVTKMRLYRTITGASTGAQFYFVVDLPFGSSTYVDTIPDVNIVGNNLLESTVWLPPVDGLDGLIALPGGMLVGFTGNTVHFCEPNRPHAWPAGYDQSLLYQIVALAVWQQQLVVLTHGFPSTGSGSSPAQFFFAQVQAPEPCIARGSVVTDLAGVYYASENGLVALNYYGMQNQSLSNFTKNIWLRDYQAEHIIACRHRAQYLAINGTGLGFLIDYTEERMGVMKISPMVAVVGVWNDVFTGDAYVIADQKVYLWDSPDTPSLTYYWKSKEFYLPAPTNLGCCQISLDPSVVDPAPLKADGPSLRDGIDIELPDGVNAMFRLYAGPGDALNVVFTRYLTKPLEIFRLPSGVKSFNWQFDITARVPLHSVQLASTMKELKQS
jgi:hypothetical protein